MSEVGEKKISFKAKIVKCNYNTDNYKVYVVDVDSKRFPYIKKHPTYKTATIVGDLPELLYNVEYEITAEQQENKYGTSYKVTTITTDTPKTKEDTYDFLKEFLTKKQADVLIKTYPNIIDIVKNQEYDKVDLSKLNGIGEYTWSKIKEKIINNFCLMDIITKFQGLLSISVVKKIYEKYTSVEVLEKKLQKNPYTTLTKIGGIGFKTADSIILQIQDKGIIDFGYDIKTSEDRCLSFLLYLLAENETNGHTKMNLVDLRKECMKIVPACSEHFVDALKNKFIYYDKNTMNVALKETYETEKYIADTILKHNKNCHNLWDYDVEKYRNVGAFDLTDEQIGTLKYLCENNIVILTACAGSGKSNSIKGVINMLDDNKKTYRLATPTGKSSKVLAEFTERQSQTIHRLLEYSPNILYYKNDEQIEKENIGKVGYDYKTHFYNNKYEKISCDVIIIDEFSMVDINLCKSLFEAIDFNKTKLLLVGDYSQLPSVGCGSLLHDFIESKVIPVSYLTKIFRYGDNGLMKVATDTRMCKPYLTKDMKSKVTAFGSDKDYVFVDLPSDLIAKNAVALYQKMLSKGYTINDIQVLSAKNVGDCGTIMLNNMLQQIANPNYGKFPNMKVGEVTYYEGDLVIETANNYNAEIYKDNQNKENENKNLFDFDYDDDNKSSNKINTAFVANGETGIIKEIYESYMIIDFDGICVKYGRSDMNMIKLGYSITVHKSQGSSVNVVILATPKSHSFLLNSNILYTGITRTRKQCYHLGEVRSINMSITKKADTQRCTFTQELLMAQKDSKATFSDV